MLRCVIVRRVIDDDAVQAGVQDGGAYVTAALGNTWGHCVNTRLIVQYLDDSMRQVRDYEYVL